MDFEWCKKHPNYTYLLGILFYFVICFVFGLFVGIASYGEQTDSTSIDAEASALFWLIYIPLSAIVIKLKNRSLWWILLAGLLSPLWLGNENEYSKYYAELQAKEERLKLVESEKVKQLEKEKKDLQDKLDALHNVRN